MKASLLNTAVKNSKLEEEINKRDPDSRPGLLYMDKQATEELLKKYDAEILAAIQDRLPGIILRLNEFFGHSHWSAIADNTGG